jgi:hypothetical protein
MVDSLRYGYQWISVKFLFLAFLLYFEKWKEAYEIILLSVYSSLCLPVCVYR